jgi:hypothetical protein
MRMADGTSACRGTDDVVYLATQISAVESSIPEISPVRLTPLREGQALPWILYTMISS